MYTPGQVIGNYRVLAKIGTGGMGSVYLAEHPLIGKKVALKVIHKELAGNREVLQRFFQEARAVGMIGNEHIIEIHDFGQSPEGDHFIIMEYLEGQTLAQALVREGRLATTRALHIAAQIATALAAAHGAGIIHRDLKPDNIMLTSRLGDPEFVKVLDFGLAKVLESSAQLTAVGVVLGTPQYMSPEACESKRPVDHRTDIYALGILLFQMVTGQLPFDGQSMGEVMVKQVTQLPPGPRGLTPEVPPAVEQIILRCLAKQPDLRFPTMLALRDALVNPDAYLVGSPLPMPARSVPPGSAGVDARTVMAYAAQHQPAAAPGARVLPLPAPAPSMSSQATMLYAGAPQVGPAAGSVGGPPIGSVPIPIVAPQNQTMVLADPAGPRAAPRRTGLWLALGLMIAVVVAATVLVLSSSSRREDGDESGSTVIATGGPGQRATSVDGAGSALAGDAGAAVAGAVPAPAPTDAGAAGAPAADAAPPPGVADPVMATAGADAAGPGAPTVQLHVLSQPAGAQVRGAGGVVLGKTPFQLVVPVGPLELEWRLAGHRTTRRSLDVTAELSEVTMTLPRRSPRPGGGKTGSGPGGDGLLDPNDL